LLQHEFCAAADDDDVAQAAATAAAVVSTLTATVALLLDEWGCVFCLIVMVALSSTITKATIFVFVEEEVSLCKSPSDKPLSSHFELCSSQA
jgi:hypothetical protein